MLECFKTCQFGILPLSFISFNSKSLTSNLQSPLLHEAILFLQSIGHVCPHTLSNALKIVFPILIFCAFWFLLLHTLLPHWQCLTVVLVSCADPWTVIFYIMSIGLHWTHCVSSILPEVLAETLLDQYSLRL